MLKFCRRLGLCINDTICRLRCDAAINIALRYRTDKVFALGYCCRQEFCSLVLSQTGYLLFSIVTDWDFTLPKDFILSHINRQAEGQSKAEPVELESDDRMGQFSCKLTSANRTTEWGNSPAS